MVHRSAWKALLALAMTAGLLASAGACGSNGGEATTDANGKPIVKIMITRWSTDIPMKDMAWTKDIEAACDCTVQWEDLADSAWGQQKSAKLAAGSSPMPRSSPSTRVTRCATTTSRI